MIAIQIHRIDANLPFQMPKQMTEGAAARDLYSANMDPIEIPPFATALIPLNFSLSMPPALCALILSRSGLAFKQGLEVLNAPGLIDSDYRGEVSVLLHNTQKDRCHVIDTGTRIAQMLFTVVPQVSFVQTNRHTATVRGSGGFGSTGND